MTTHQHEIDENGTEWCPATVEHEPQVEIEGAFWASPRIQRNGECYYDASPAILTDAQAAALTFRADPAVIRLGAYVEITDGGGVRIGHVASATYHEPMFGPGHAVCTIKLS